jgi:ribosomal protein S18 acetylase RimI-like enzyme
MAIYVLSEYYSSGVGFQLMSESLKKLNEYNKIIVWVLKDNERAISFYEKLGFKFDGKEKTLKLVTDIVERRMILDL